MVQVQTHNDTYISVAGTWNVGYLNNTQGQQLVEKFGEPLLGQAGHDLLVEELRREVVRADPGVECRRSNR